MSDMEALERNADLYRAEAWRSTVAYMVDSFDRLSGRTFMV